MDDPFPAGMVECIERFLSTDHLRPSGLDLYLEVFDTSLMFPLQRPAEMRTMIQAVRPIEPKVVMEIGTDKGGGLYHWCKCFPTVQTVIACEIRGLPYFDLFQQAFPTLHFLWLGQSSQGRAVDNVQVYLEGRTIDVLFLDGDKEAYQWDWDAYLPLMSPNGIVLIHDINDRNPSLFYQDKIGRGYHHKTIIDLRDTAWALERQSRGIPAQSPHEEWLRLWRGRSCGVGVIYLGPLETGHEVSSSHPLSA